MVGLDFSENSLAYAKNQAKEAGIEIEYHLGNYLEYKDNRQFDLITLVMCDLCALNPSQRATLLAKFKSLLAPNGSIVLDVYTAHRFKQQAESLNVERNAMNGFWSGEDYWCIQSSFTYQSDLVTLDKYVISQEDKEWTVYNWLQHFTVDQLTNELNAHGLEIKQTYSDLRGTPFTEADEMAVVIGHQS
ncbi:class I SAM-dependent methyltransferase [Vibrio mexicanus]|uniref:class I SAM-dependent methyltransferase n=1 Tax=Vibrio mexicanus TaxID=1004326 RepID=UPI000B1B2A21|nr:class I SAM-dependent methyltransferase [Vibrio mexicanus]